MAKFNLRSKRTWKKILSIGLGILLTVGAVFGISALISKSEETTKTIKPTYEIGGLTEDGAYSETNESIYSDAFECQGLSVQLDFDHNISYEIFYYNEYSDFISSTGTLTENYNTVDNLMPANTVFARIEITPNEDSSISWYEKSKYSKQLTIEVFKDQTDLSNTESLVDLFNVDTENIGKAGSVGSGQSFGYIDNYSSQVTTPINCTNIKKISIVFYDSSDNQIRYFFVNSDNLVVSHDYITYNKGKVTINVPDNVLNLYVNYTKGLDISIYKLA